MDDYTAIANDFIDELQRMCRRFELMGFRNPIAEVRVSADLGLRMGIPPGTAAVFDGVVVHADAEVVRASAASCRP